MAELAQVSPLAFASLIGAAFVAGFIDAIAGGGGLITVPAMALAGLDPVTAIATNKLQSSFGSGSAALSFARAGHLSWRDAMVVAPLAAGGAVLGASLLSRAPTAAIADALPFMLAAMGVYFALSPRLSNECSRARMAMSSGRSASPWGPGNFSARGLARARRCGLARGSSSPC